MDVESRLQQLEQQMGRLQRRNTLLRRWSMVSTCLLGVALVLGAQPVFVTPRIPSNLKLDTVEAEAFTIRRDVGPVFGTFGVGTDRQTAYLSMRDDQGRERWLMAVDRGDTPVLALFDRQRRLTAMLRQDGDETTLDFFTNGRRNALAIRRPGEPRLRVGLENITPLVEARAVRSRVRIGHGTKETGAGVHLYDGSGKPLGSLAVNERSSRLVFWNEDGEIVEDRSIVPQAEDASEDAEPAPAAPATPPAATPEALPTPAETPGKAEPKGATEVEAEVDQPAEGPEE